MIKGLCAMPTHFFIHLPTPTQGCPKALKSPFVEDLSARESARKFSCSIQTRNGLRGGFKAASIMTPLSYPAAKRPPQPCSFALQSTSGHPGSENKTSLLVMKSGKIFLCEVSGDVKKKLREIKGPGPM